MSLPRLLVTLLTSSFLACSHPPDPAKVYLSIQNDFVHGALDVAHANAERARVDFSNSRAAGIDWPLRFRLLEADILTYQGQREEVIGLLSAPDVNFPITGDDAIKRNLLLGLAHYGIGQSDLSAQELHTARDLANASNSGLMGEVLRTDGIVQLYDDKLNDALDLFKRSLAQARTRGDAFLEASDLLNIGFVTSHLEQFDAAVPLLREAATFAEQVQAQTVMQAALGNLGEVYLQLGDFEKALDSYQRAERLAVKIGATRNEIDWLQWVGLSYYKLGNLTQAKLFYERALVIAKSLHVSSEIAEIDANLAFVLLRRGDYAAAASVSTAAVDAAREAADPAAARLPRLLQAMLAERLNRSDEAERLLTALHEEAAGDTASLRWEVENALANLYAARHESGKAEAWYRRSIETFEAQRDSVRDESLKLSFFANGDSLYRDYADHLIATGRPNEALQLLDQDRARTLEEGLAATDKAVQGAHRTTADPESVARRLDGRILFYALGPDRSYLWVVTATATHLFTLPKQEDVEALIARYQKAVLRSSDPLREGNSAATELYAALVAPASAMIPRGSRIFLIRDGALNALNFEMLLAPSGAGLQYWIESVSLANASSIRLLAGRTDPEIKSAKALLLIGDPTASGQEYERLSSAATEIEDVQRHFDAAHRTVYSDVHAIPSAYSASKPDRFSYIHFVAHATASTLSPLDSAVVLSRPSDDPDSFKLYARDILKYPLHAHLVTVSACYGSGLRNFAGEGMVGLAWAFLRAGSHDVIAALWEVDDASTPVLMDRLYAEIEQGATAETALRAAKLSMIHSTGVYRKPFYWGAFQLYSGL